MNQDAPGAASAKRSRGMSKWMLRTLMPVAVFMYRRGMTRKLGKMQQVLLTTTGRKSGKPHTVPLGAVPEGDGWIVIGSNGGADVDPNWWLNMVAHPDVTVQVNDQVSQAHMQEITNPADRERIWNNVLATSQGYANYTKKTARKIPLGWLRPV